MMTIKELLIDFYNARTSQLISINSSDSLIINSLQVNKEVNYPAQVLFPTSIYLCELFNLQEDDFSYQLRWWSLECFLFSSGKYSLSPPGAGDSGPASAFFFSNLPRKEKDLKKKIIGSNISSERGGQVQESFLSTLMEIPMSLLLNPWRLKL